MKVAAAQFGAVFYLEIAERSFILRELAQKREDTITVELCAGRSRGEETGHPSCAVWRVLRSPVLDSRTPLRGASSLIRLDPPYRLLLTAPISASPPRAKDRVA
jgi:hypothetical protein